MQLPEGQQTLRLKDTKKVSSGNMSFEKTLSV